MFLIILLNNITTLDLGLNFVDFNLFNNSNLAIGFRVNVLLNQKNIGINNYNIYSQGPVKTDISDKIEKRISNMGLTLKLNFGEIELNDKAYLKPYYSLFIFPKNFDDFNILGSFQNGLGIAIGLNKKEK